MNKKVFTILTAMLILFSIQSKATDVIVDVNAGNINIMGQTVNIPDFEKWYYFSFSVGDTVGTSPFVLENLNGGGIGTEVPNAAWEARTDWDIAFHVGDIRTNGAKAVLVADEASTTPLADVYNALTSVPTSGFEADGQITGTFTQSMSSMPPPRAIEINGCIATNGWATYGMGGAIVKPIVVVFELSNGTYVKAHLKEFADANGAPGFISMSYATLGGAASVGTTEEVIFNIYPNPTTDVLNVELTEAAMVSIFNLTGSLVSEQFAQAGTFLIPVNNLAAGTYFVKVNNTVQKFIVR